MPGQDLSPQEYADEYAASRARIRAIVERAPTGATSTVIPSCPDWTVHSLCAHLAGIACDLVNRNNPSGDAQAWVDRQIAERSDRTLGSLLDEWDEYGPRFEAIMVNHPRSFSGLVMDVVAHEHDLCGALGIVGDRSSKGVRATMFIEAYQILDRDLPARGLAATRFIADGDEWIAGTGPVELTLDLSGHENATWELIRLLGSRRSMAQLRTYPWQGDLDRYVVGLAHMPLPTEDLVE